MRPSASRMYTVSTVSPFGSWNDDVFSGSANDFPLLSAHDVEHPIAGDMRGAHPPRLRLRPVERGANLLVAAATLFGESIGDAE